MLLYLFSNIPFVVLTEKMFDVLVDGYVTKQKHKQAV